MNDDVITYLDESEPINNEINKPKKVELPDNNNEFIKGLPDWDLEPPYELIKRSNL